MNKSKIINAVTNTLTSTKFSRVSFLNKAIQIIIGIVILGLAHFVGFQLKSIIYMQGKQDIKDIIRGGKEEDESQKSKKDNMKQAQQTKLVFVTLGQIVYYVTMGVAVLIVLRVLGIETASLIAVIGTIGFALGLALQGSLSDIASGILLALLQTYSIGDVIQVEDTQGKVKNFNMFHTVVEDLNTGALVTIPNSKLQDSIIYNHTKQNKRLVVVDVLTSNKNKDFKKIIDVIRNNVNELDYVLKDPQPIVGVLGMQEVGTTIRAKVAISTSDYPDKMIPLTTSIREALAKNEIDLVDPF